MDISIPLRTALGKVPFPAEAIFRMRQDHRPYRVKRWFQTIERTYVRAFVAPHLDALGEHSLIMKPWRLKIHGPNIRIGRSVHIVTATDRLVCLTTWVHESGAGRIDIGDYVLLCPGVRIDSATHIEIGANTMIAAGAYLTDADWHDVYDRTKPIGQAAKICIRDNVWIGDGVTVCKGVTIGTNSVIGTGSVVTKDIPANVIAAGNPATVVKPLDPGTQLVGRDALLADAQALELATDNMDKYLLGNNTWWNWLRTLVKPRRGD